jgi:hypothetical protein
LSATLELEHPPEATEDDLARRKHRKRLIMSVGDKGGSGKSTAIKIVAELHLARRRKLLLIDGDATVGTLYKYHPEVVQPFSIHGPIDERDRLVNEYLSRGVETVIVDLPATSLTRLREMSAEYSFVEEVERAGYRLTVVAPVTPNDDPILDLQEVIGLFDPENYALFSAWDESSPMADHPPEAKPSRFDIVAFVNMSFAEDRSDFQLWDASQPGGFTRRLMEFVGGVEIEIPKLRPRIQHLLQRYRLSYRGAETSPNLSVTDRGRIQRWNKSVNEVVTGVGERLGF